MNAPDPVDPRQIVLSMRRAASRIVQAEGEDAVLRELHQGAQSLAGTCPVALHRSRERAGSSEGGTLVPVLVHGTQRAGALVIGDGARPADELVVAAAGQLAALCGLRLGQIQLQRAVVQQSVQLAQLNDLSRRLNSAETTEAALECAAEGAGALCGAPELGLYQVREGLLVLTGCVGDPADFPVTLRALSSRGTVLFGGDRGHPLPLGRSLLGGRPVVLQVLRTGDRVEGLLVLRSASDATEWDETETVLAEGLAEHLAVALRHIDLLERSRHQAAYDDLTGLASRRQFMVELARETERVRRQGSPLSLLMIDADRFKVVNDTCGHTGGDEVLRALAGCLRRGTRSLDVVGRLGGEELGVLLTGADEETAVMVAERLRSSIEAMSVPFKDQHLRVTVSIGVAEWDGEMTYEDLMEAADEALYRSKADGRNRVTAGGALETVIV